MKFSIPILILVFLHFSCSLFYAQNLEQTTAQELRSYSTLHSIGFEWDILGDSDHDATCTVRYRKYGTSIWKTALPLFRIDYAWYYAGWNAEKPANMFAGSILFLSPDTEYEIQLLLNDPDGGSMQKDLRIRTRPVPVLPSGGRTFYVMPGLMGGGDGSLSNPFRGISEAEKFVRPGDMIILLPGEYGSVVFNKSGESFGKYVAWKAKEKGKVIFDNIVIRASYLWLEGVDVISKPGFDGSGIYGVAGVEGVVLVQNRISGFKNFCINIHPSCSNWYIADNTLIGTKGEFNSGAAQPIPLSGEGVELNESKGMVVAYNSISRVADGISYPGTNCDIYGNDIFDVTDDGVETDRGWANNRVWGNRITNVGNYVFSFQPMYCGPWYFIRNQAIASMYQDTELRYPAIFKFRVQDRFLFAHNTCVFGRWLDVYMDNIFLSFCKNNLFISSTGNKPIWISMRYTDPNQAQYVLPLQVPSWKTDVDYNGYDWGSDTTNWRNPVFRGSWSDVLRENYCIDLAEFVQRTGIERHSLRVHKEDLFTEWNIPSTAGRVSPERVLLLRDTSPAIDAGVRIAGINDFFTGVAPDLGAYELGYPLPHYGPRSSESLQQRYDYYWALDKSESRIRLGDVSGNGTITVKDAVLAFLLGIGRTLRVPEDTVLSLKDQFLSADVSGDGKISSFDAALIVQYAVGLINKFPAEIN